MAGILPTPAQVRALSLSGEFATIPDATIEDTITAEAAPVYSAPDLKQHTQWTRAVALLTAHILHIQKKLEDAGGNIAVLGGVKDRRLDGVGSRSYAWGGMAATDAVDWLNIPSPYLGRLLIITKTFPPSVHATANSTIANTWGGGVD